MQPSPQTPDGKIIPFLRKTESALTILTVEDDRIERMFLEQQIVDLGHNMLAAADGREALDMLQSRGASVDVILMDRIMPVMDGLTAVRRIKDDPTLRRIPIVMLTGAATDRDMQEGIDAGVFYYLTKPVNDEILRSVLSAAAREASQLKSLNDELRRHCASFHLIDTCKFRFRTVEEAEALATFMAMCFPDPERTLPGLAELLINAVEHGIYGVGYERKSELLSLGTLRAEIIRRQSLPDYDGRMAEAVIAHKDNGIYAVITDPGNGFEWKKFLSIEPSRAQDNHGRGIAQANALSFDKLTYNETGNQAIAFVSREGKLEW